jgi:hypothetical protein
MGRLAEAETVLREALAIRERLRDDHNAAVTWYSLGAVARDRGDAEEGIRLWARAAVILDAIDPERATVIRDHIKGLTEP